MVRHLKGYWVMKKLYINFCIENWIRSIFCIYNIMKITMYRLMIINNFDLFVKDRKFKIFF